MTEPTRLEVLLAEIEALRAENDQLRSDNLALRLLAGERGASFANHQPTESPAASEETEPQERRGASANPSSMSASSDTTGASVDEREAG